MLNNQIVFLPYKNWIMISIIIPISIMTLLLVSQGYAFFATTLYLFILVCIVLNSVENLFLFWLFLFSFFSTNSVYFLTFGTQPVFTFDRVLIVSLCSFVLMGILIKKRKLTTRINMVEIALLLFLLVIIFSSIKTKSEYHGIGRILDIFIIPFVVYFLAKKSVKNEKQLRRFINVLITLGIFLSLIGMYESISKNNILTGYYGLHIRSDWLRVNGPYDNDAVFGVNVVMCFFAILYKYSILERIKNSLFINKLFYISILCLLSLVVFLNYYRGIWLALIFGLLFWFILRRKKLKRLFLYIFIFLLVLIPMLNNLQNSFLFQSRILRIDTIMFRLNLFRISFDIFKQNPLTGLGLFNHFNISATNTGSHSTYLAILADMGILGFCMFMFLIIALFYQSVKNYRLAINDYEKEFFVFFICIILVYLISGIGLLICYQSNINKLFFALAGVASNKSFISKENT